MDSYAITKQKLLQVQSSLDGYSGLKDKILPYTWTLHDPKTNQLLVEYVVAGRSQLEARLFGNLYFTVDRSIPEHVRLKYINDDITDRIIDVEPMW